jgi:hypothetical protein
MRPGLRGEGLGVGAAQVWTLIMRIAPGGERYQRAVEVTDAWSADNAFAGSRALRVGRGEWVQVGTASRKSIGSGGHEVRGGLALGVGL